MEQAQREGFDSEILTNELQGEARDVGIMLAKICAMKFQNVRVHFA
ncbi:MAG: hypothetical protein U0X87_01005 [Anaerolineales bacterium]